MKFDADFWRGFWDGWAELLEFFPEPYEPILPSAPEKLSQGLRFSDSQKQKP